MVRVVTHSAVREVAKARKNKGEATGQLELPVAQETEKCSGEMYC